MEKKYLKLEKPGFWWEEGEKPTVFPSRYLLKFETELAKKKKTKKMTVTRILYLAKIIFQKKKDKILGTKWQHWRYSFWICLNHSLKTDSVLERQNKNPQTTSTTILGEKVSKWNPEYD